MIAIEASTAPFAGRVSSKRLDTREDSQSAHVMPSVRRQKNEGNDAEVICTRRAAAHLVGSRNTIEQQEVRARELDSLWSIAAPRVS
jgi:hypothetical protein